jgi:hypothetical protein
VYGILVDYARGRGFDFRTVQTFVCMNMSVCIRSGYFLCILTYIYLYLSCFIPEGVAEAEAFRYSSETPTLYQNYLAMRNTAHVRGGKHGLTTCHEFKMPKY